jgi:UDP-N-acetylglucosamine transferase subunit ALG13
LSFVELPGYQIKYDKNRALTILRLLRSIPKILIRIKQERACLRAFSARERPDLVISDNRYGLTVPGVLCVLMTHQLLIRSPFGRWADLILQKLHYRLIGRFSRCWVPDVEAGEGLAGELSHPGRMPAIPVRYVGWLSRFGEGGQDGPNDIELLVLLSGPEPQRSLLEESILQQASSGLVIVRGLPEGGKKIPAVPPGVVVYDHLPAAELEGLIKRARLVVARPGYSTVMDLARLGKRALFIPTPGQTEQEYLGSFLGEKGWAVCTGQDGLSLAAALEMARAGDGPRLEVTEPPGLLRAAIADLLGQLHS